ncbi:hypothetical protein EVAR_92467_1 [Eumeta japonica]|uniref:Uncharacterized protein n=1 Tax=Eumeta variegata TaxID=151549 RepID=A0A4C1T8Q3_EUMVA|nr:hypothetical protein EVAR_92467_1 [Eumeta japonica]
MPQDLDPRGPRPKRPTRGDDGVGRAGRAGKAAAAGKARAHGSQYFVLKIWGRSGRRSRGDSGRPPPAPVVYHIERS